MEDDPFEIHPKEKIWVQNYHFLLNKGYQLRKRYEPGWVGSWVSKGIPANKIMSLGINNAPSSSDIRWQNVMMDTSLCPKGFNPLINYTIYEKHHPSERHLLDRIDIKPEVRYYLIDYGYSIKFPGEERFRVFNTGAEVKLKEFFTVNPKTGKRVYALHDPFKADMLHLRQLFRRAFGWQLTFLEPLMASLRRDPDERPDAKTALAMFHELTKGLSRAQLLRPVSDRLYRMEDEDDCRAKARRFTRRVQGGFDWGRLVIKAIALNRGRSF